MQKHAAPLQKAAKAAAAAALAVSPVTLAAAPAAASMDTPTEFVIAENGMYPLLLPNYFNGMYNYDVQFEQGDESIADVEFRGDWMIVRGVSEGTVAFTVTAGRLGEGTAREQPFTFTVLESGGDGRIDLADIIAYTKKNPERADELAEAKHLLHGLETTAINQPPLPAHILPYFPVAAGPETVTIDLKELYFDPDGDEIVDFQLIGGFFEPDVDAPPYDQYITIQDGHLLKINIPYAALRDAFPFGVMAAATDAQGNTLEYPLLFIPYNKYATWYPGEENSFSAEVWLGSMFGVVGEGMNYHVRLPAGRDDLSADIFEGVLTVTSTLTADSPLLERIPIEVELSVDGFYEGEESGGGIMLKMELVLVRGSSHESLYPTEGQEAGLWVIPTEEPTGPYPLRGLFADEDFALYNEKLSYEIEGIAGGGDDTAEFFYIDGSSGEFVFDMESYLQYAEGYPPTDDPLFDIRAEDAGGHVEYAKLRVDFNTAPQPAVFGKLALLADDLYGSAGVFYEIDGDAMEFSFLPSSVEDALDIAVVPASGSLYSMTFGTPPAETTEFSVIATDEHGSSAEVEVQIVVPEEREFYYDADASMLVDLDALFEEPGDEEFTYEVLNYTNNGGYTYVELFDHNTLSLSNLEHGGSFSIVAKAEDSSFRKYTRFAARNNGIQLNPVMPYLEPTVTGDVYEATIGPDVLGEVFPEADDAAYAYYYAADFYDIDLVDSQSGSPSFTIRSASPYVFVPEWITIMQVEKRPGHPPKYRVETIRLGGLT